jgi:hypothetical protein
MGGPHAARGHHGGVARGEGGHDLCDLGYLIAHYRDAPQRQPALAQQRAREPARPRAFPLEILRRMARCGRSEDV